MLKQCLLMPSITLKCVVAETTASCGSSHYFHELKVVVYNGQISTDG